MKDSGINKGLVQEFNTSDRRSKGAFYGFRKMFWDYAKKLHIPFVDDCCDDASVADTAPVRFNVAEGKMEYYNATTDTWTDITAFTTTTTTTSTTTTTTAA